MFAIYPRFGRKSPTRDSRQVLMTDELVLKRFVKYEHMAIHSITLLLNIQMYFGTNL